MVEFVRGNVSFIGLLALILVIKFVNGQFINGFSHSGSSEIEIGDIESNEIYSVAENAFNKRQHNSQNRFKNMMINKDNADLISDDYTTSKDGPISFYIPRTAPMNGKKRGAILSWALPSSRMRVGNSNYRQPSNFGIPNSRPAAK